MQKSDLYTEKKITHEEINLALQEYLAKGGKIHTFPPQVAVASNLIHIPLAAYESVGEFTLGDLMETQAA